MKKSLLVLISLLTQLASIAQAAEDESLTPEKMVAMHHSYGSSYDFESLAPYVHPYTLSQFRVICDDLIDTFSKSHSQEIVFKAFYGVNTPDDLRRLSDEEYWIYVMGTINSFFDEEKGGEHIKFISNVEDEEYLFVYYRTKKDLKSTPEKEHLSTPKCITLKRHNGSWHYYSFEVSRVELFLKWYVKYHRHIEAAAEQR